MNAKDKDGEPLARSIDFGRPRNGQALAFASFSNNCYSISYAVNRRYEFENPFLFTSLLTHEFLHQLLTPAQCGIIRAQEEGFSLYEEVTANYAAYLMYLDQLSRHPGLAESKTELTQMLNRGAMALLNSGMGAEVGLFAANRGESIYPGGVFAILNFYDFVRHSYSDNPTLDGPKHETLERYLKFIQKDFPAISGFNRALLEDISRIPAALPYQDLVRAAKALKLNVDTQ